MRHGFAAALCACALVIGGTRQSPPLAVVDVDVIPMDSERVLRRQTVIVRDGLIATIGPETSVVVPRDARRVDVRCDPC